MTDVGEPYYRWAAKAHERYKAAKQSQDRAQLLSVFAPTLLRMHDPSSEQANTPIENWINGIAHLCLYVDQIWVPDVYEILDKVQMEVLAVHAPIITNPNLLEEAVKSFHKLRPLIDSGIVCLYPPLEAYEEHVAEPLFGSRRGYREDELESAWPHLYVAEGLLFARAFRSSYAALHEEEFSALNQAIAEISANTNMGRADKRLLAVLPRLQIPLFEHLDAKTLVEARSNEAAFEDFRTLLRSMSSRLISGLGDPDFDRDVKDFETDVVNPGLQQLYDGVTGSTYLKKNLSDAGISFASAALAGAIITGNPLVAAATGGVSVLAKLVFQSLKGPPAERPAADLVYLFHTGRPTSADIGLAESYPMPW